MLTDLDMCLECKQPSCDGACRALLDALKNRPDRQAGLKLTWKETTMPISKWAERLGISRTTIYRRLSRGESIDKVLSAPKGRRLTAEQINYAYTMLSGMATNFRWYYSMPALMDNSRGFVAQYGPHVSGKTNKVSRPTEQQAIAEASLNDEQLEALEWVHCILDVLEEYSRVPCRFCCHPRMRRIRRFILEKRALDGLSLANICELLISEGEMTNQKQVRNWYRFVVHDVATVAYQRRLLDDIGGGTMEG